jgi:hypothetical protein
MRTTPHHLLRPLAVALVAGAAAAPTAAADHQDLRWPGAKDAARGYLEPVTIERAQDLRMPDRRDTVAALTDTAPPVEFARVSPDGGFDWGDAGIGAGAVLAVIALGLGGSVALVHRRRDATAARQTAPTA